MGVKDHYANHLAPVYSWMTGDLKLAVQKQRQFFIDHHIVAQKAGVAIDLGAGHGIQTLALAELGFHVHAIDFDELLISELQKNSFGMPVSVIRGDIRNLQPYYKLQAELIACCGDTLTHLNSINEVTALVTDCHKALASLGKLVLTFRDYSRPLTGDARFIPVKNDENRILTCFLEYSDRHVTVTDLLYEKADGTWQQKISSYQKVIIHPATLASQLMEIGLIVIKNEPIDRMQTIIAQKV